MGRCNRVSVEESKLRISYEVNGEKMTWQNFKYVPFKKFGSKIQKRNWTEVCGKRRRGGKF